MFKYRKVDLYTSFLTIGNVIEAERSRQMMMMMMMMTTTTTATTATTRKKKKKKKQKTDSLGCVARSSSVASGGSKGAYTAMAPLSSLTTELGSPLSEEIAVETLKLY